MLTGRQIFLGAAVAVSAVAAWKDYRTGEIPNRLTLLPLALAPLAHAALAFRRGGAGAALEAGGLSIFGAVACAIVPLLLYRAGGMFGGDVKLLAAIGALCLPLAGIEAEFYAFLSAALYAPARLAYEGKLLRTLRNTLSLVLNPFLPEAKRREVAPEMMTELRFGPAVFAGTLASAWLHWGAP